MILRACLSLHAGTILPDVGTSMCNMKLSRNQSRLAFARWLFNADYIFISGSKCQFAVAAEQLHVHSRFQES